MKHNPNVTANAVAVTTAIIYIVCRVGVSLFPDLSMTIAQSWFHGIQLTQISELNFSLGSFILGLVTLTVGTWLVGYLFANLYNYFAKK
ncbi:MAG: DUF5676 family membrane protein [Patescibacteria group bacterium]